MNNKLYFSMTYSIELSSLEYKLRGLHSLFTIVNKSPELHSSIVLLDHKIKRYVISTVTNLFNISQLELSHVVDTAGNNVIYCEFIPGVKSPIFMWKLHFAGYVRPGKRPLSKTAVIIARLDPYRSDFELLADILR